MTQFETAFAAYDFTRYTTLCLYNEGNFFNEDELPAAARVAILRTIARTPSIRSVILESLPRFLTPAVLGETRTLLGDRELEVGIGLESSDPLVRSLCVNKPYGLDEYERVVPLVRRYAKVLAYVLVRPAFLTESEALVDAVRTCRYAFDRGADIVSLEPVNLSPHNMSGALARAGLHGAPWLWSVFEVVRAIHIPGRVRIGGDQFAPTYDHHAHNCPICTGRARDLVSRYNATDEVGLLGGLDCACRSTWAAELDTPTPPLLDRIEVALDRLEMSFGITN